MVRTLSSPFPVVQQGTRRVSSCFGYRRNRQAVLPTSGFTGRLKTEYSVRRDSHKYKTVEVISRTSDTHLTYKIRAGISSTPDISLSASSITKQTPRTIKRLPKHPDIYSNTNYSQNYSTLYRTVVSGVSSLYENGMINPVHLVYCDLSIQLW
jgi:hypothetical protein